MANKSYCRYRNNVRTILAKVRNRYKIHNRPFNFSDFRRICRIEGIHVFSNFSKLPLGFYSHFRKVKFIYLNEKAGRKTLYVALHELGHYFLHQDQMTKNYFRKTTKAELKAEKEANLFAELAMKGGRK